jgi:hypothetical protein
MQQFHLLTTQYAAIPSFNYAAITSLNYGAILALKSEANSISLALH